MKKQYVAKRFPDHDGSWTILGPWTAYANPHTGKQDAFRPHICDIEDEQLARKVARLLNAADD